MSKISTIIRNIAASALALTALTACDEVAQGDRYIEMDEIVPQRSVLLLDLTGQTCSNCPRAHELLEKLEEQYGDSLIAVSMHAGPLSMPVERTRLPNNVCLKYAQGDSIDSEYNTLNSYPAGVVDMRKPALNDDGWSSAVRLAFTYKPQATIELQSAVEGDRVDVTVTVSSPLDIADGRLCIWLLEDSIVAPQVKEGAGTIRDYVHNNVFRRSFGSVNGIGLNLSEGEPVTFNLSVQIPDTDKEVFNRDRLKVVAFVKDNNGVLEAARVKVQRH